MASLIETSCFELAGKPRVSTLFKNFCAIFLSALDIDKHYVLNVDAGQDAPISVDHVFADTSLFVRVARNFKHILLKRIFRGGRLYRDLMSLCRVESYQYFLCWIRHLSILLGAGKRPVCSGRFLY